MSLNLPITQPLRVEFDAEVGGREWLWVITAHRLPPDVIDRVRERETGANLADIFTDALLADRLVSWQSEALRDVGTGEMLPLKQLPELLREAPEVRSVLAGALFRVTAEAARKNSPSSSAGTTAPGQDSAADAEPAGEPAP